MESTETIMRKCMGTDKLKVSIVMAVYNPNFIWLVQQFTSLNEQTYDNLELYVMDDCSPKVNFDKLCDWVHQYVTNFPVNILQNDKNLGSNNTFSYLTGLVQGEYIAYCDQDDIWERDKIAVLVETIQREKSVLAYSDMSVIDGDGGIIAKTLKEIRPRIDFVSGTNLMKVYAFANCTAGCSMVVESDIAKRALPFIHDTVYDQWICLVASACGKISYVNRQLVKYRQHGENQTGILTGTVDKASYEKMRITPMVNRVTECKRRMEIPEEIVEFARVRQQKNLLGIWKYRGLCKKDAMFELAMACTPNWMVKILLAKIRGKYT